MKIQLRSCAAILCLAGLIALPTLAIASTATSSDNQELQRQLSSLQKEVKNLESQISANKTQTDYQQAQARHARRVATRRTTQKTNAPVDNVPSQRANSVSSSASVEPLSKTDLVRMIQEERDYLPFDLDVPGQAFVSTGPYVGVPIQYAGSNLIVNSPSVNTDLILLKIRRSIHRQLLAMGGELFKEPYHSHLLLSGVLEGVAGYLDRGGYPSTSTIDIDNVSIDAFFIGPSDWLQGFIELNYDNGPPAGSFYVVSNSHVFVNKAFVTIGDLLRSPIYGTFGQFYVPFGTYSSVMVSNTLTQLLARTKARAIELGFNIPGDNAPYGSVYIFRGDSHAASVSKINNGGINIAYKFKYGTVSGNIGGGFIANIADSGGLQYGAGFRFYEQLHHRVPAYNLRGMASLGNRLTFIAEYVGARSSFNPNDLSFNGAGAQPWAIDMQGAYSFTILDNKPSAVGIGYDTSNQALALGIPLARYFVVFNTSLWRNTLQSLEIRHDRNYPASNTANGPVAAEAVPGACTSFTCTSTGKSDNAITAQFDYYF